MSKSLKYVFIFIMAQLMISTQAMSSIGIVQNLSSGSHTSDEPSQITRIETAWINPLSYSDSQLSGYITVFNNQADYTITTGNTIDRKWDISDSFENKDDVSYYFHIAAVASGVPNQVLYPAPPFLEIGETRTAGPYRIDTVAPTNLSVAIPNTTTTRTIDVHINATGASKMCISNSDYGNCTWEDYASLKSDWLLTDGDGLKQVYIQFRDEALNVSNALIAACEYTEPVVIQPQSPEESRVATIPTLTEWGEIVFICLILFGACIVTKRSGIQESRV